MTYSIFPTDGDTITEQAWTAILDRGNARDYVERGLTVSLNGDGTVDVSAGLAFIRDANGQQTYPVEDETGTTGVQLATTSGTNYIYLTFDPSASDVEGSVTYHVDTDESPPAGQPSLLIAEADESTSTVTAKNAEPTVGADSLPGTPNFPDGASFGGGEGFTRIDRRTPSSDTGTIQFTGLANDVEYRIFYNSVMSTSGGDVFARANGDGTSTGNYFYWDASATKQTSENEFLLVTLSNNSPFAGTLTVTNARYTADGRVGLSNTFLPAISDRTSDFGREGGRDIGAALSSIELVADDDFNGGQTVVELWERPY